MPLRHRPYWHIVTDMQFKQTPATHREIIVLLGGPSALARALGLRAVNTTVHWSTRGIPSKHWHKVIPLLSQADINLTADDLERMRFVAPSYSRDAA